MVMKKNLLIAAIAITALAGCTSDEYIGDNSPTVVQGTNVAINFSSKAGKMTRATSNEGTVAQMLDGQMKIYGIKKKNAVAEPSTPAVYTGVFQNYVVWSNTTNVTTSNPDAKTATTAENGWEYVAASGQSYGSTTTAGTTSANQYIKYWDYSTDEYHFVAGSPVNKFEYTITDGEITGATVRGIAGHLNPNTSTALSADPVYIATPVKKSKASNEYNTDVQFSFTRQQAYVRVGVYETIPGYKITEIKFYPYNESNDAWGTTPGNNIVLASTVTDPAKYFQGASNGTATISYSWTTPGYTFDYASEGLTRQKNWYGGAFNYAAVVEPAAAAWEMATSSAETDIDKLYGTDSDRGTKGYFTVIPMKSEATAYPILVKCDYVLTALDGSGPETIKVSGATAAIPAAFSKWNPNTTYTYLFKISDNTNGTTGTVGTHPEGLFPITFDAAVIAKTDATNLGFITTVSTPSITTYQEGSVVDVTTPTEAHGVKYVEDKTIYFTAQNDETGELNTLTSLNNESPAIGMVKVYSVTAGSTEADLIVTRPTTTVDTTIGSSAWSINGQSVASGKWASFTPSDPGTYAIEYVTSTSPSYAYKVIVVE